jgi:ankyrin repeat protein
VSWRDFSQAQGELVRMLIAAGADVNAKDAYGTTALWESALYGLSNNVEALLEAGADVNIFVDGLTPLHAATGILAAENEYDTGTFQERERGMFRYLGEVDFLGVVKELVQAGADVNARSARNAVMPMPIDKAWKDNAFTNKTPLDFARMLGNEEAARYLKSVGAQSARKWYWPF